MRKYARTIERCAELKGPGQLSPHFLLQRNIRRERDVYNLNFFKKKNQFFLHG